MIFVAYIYINYFTVDRIPSNNSQRYIKFTDNIKTVALPPASDASKTFEGTLATVSGFGRTVDSKSLSHVN
jgi:hypothetical protein